MSEVSLPPSSVTPLKKSKKPGAQPSSSAQKTGETSTATSEATPPCHITYKDIRSPFFSMAMRKLSGHPFRDQKVAYRVMRIIDAVEGEQKTAARLYEKLVRQFAELDDKGEFVPNNGEAGTFVVKKDVETYEKALKDFEELAIDLKWRKVQLQDLSEIHLAAAELKALTPVVHFPED